MARRIAIHNHKGGVGKTTTAISLAAVLAQKGKRVLLVDFDGQANATSFLGRHDLVDAEGVWTSVEFCRGQGFSPIRDVAVPGLDLIPSSLRLLDLEVELMGNVLDGVHHLRRAVERVQGDYDFIIVDCSPSFGMLAINPFAACNELIVPAKADPGSLPGLQQLSARIESQTLSINPQLHILGVLTTQFREVGSTSKQVAEGIRGLFGNKVFATVIHTADAHAKAAGEGVPLVLAQPTHRGAVEYTQLAQEVLDRG